LAMEEEHVSDDEKRRALAAWDRLVNTLPDIDLDKIETLLERRIGTLMRKAAEEAGIPAEEISRLMEEDIAEQRRQIEARRKST
jgi:hypothetical protein